MSNFKKAFTITVSVLTILWSAGFAFAPTGVSAAAAAGDLIKMAGNPAVYFLGSDGKRYVFPTQATYMSWYKDFSGVKTIPSSELASYLLGGNISIRPGTKLVKITTDPRVYAVEPGGMLRHIGSEAIAAALYGSNWAQRVVDVPDQFFANSYKYGTGITSNVHPTGTVVKYASGSTLYYIENGMKRPFASAAAEAANMIDAANAITTTITYPDGSSITAMEAAIWNVAGSSSSTPTSAAGLTVAAGSMTASTSLPRGATSVKVGEWNFTAGPEGAVTVSGVTFKRMGVGSTSDISNAYLYDGANRLTSGRTFNTSTNEVTFTVSISVPAGSTKTLALYVSIATGAASGNQHSFVVESSSKVSSNATAVNGTFPTSSNTHSIAGALAGTLTIQKSGSLSNPKVGDRGAKVSEFRLDASTEDAWVNQITLTQGGAISNSSLSNFMLKQGGTTVATASAIASNDRLALVFSPAFKIEKGNNRIFELFADIEGRPTTDTISFYAEDVADVMATGGTFGVGMTPTINANFDSSSDTGLTLTLQGGQFTITFDGPSSANISNAGQDVVVWKGTIYSANTVEVRNWRFRIQDTNATDPDLADAAATAAIQDIKLWNLDNNTVIAGPNELTAAADVQSQVVNFTDDYTLNAGSTTHIGLSVDVKNTPSNITLLVSMSDLTNSFTANDIKNVGSNTYLTLGTDIVPSTPIAGQSQTITSAALTVSMASSPTDSIIVKGVAGYTAAAFNFAANSGSSVRITTLAVTGQIGNVVTLYGASGAASGGSATVSDVILSAKLMDGTTQIGTTKTFTSGVATFDSLNWVIPASQTKKLDVVITTNSAASLGGGTDFMRFVINADTGITAVDTESNSLADAQITVATGSGPTNEIVGDTDDDGAILIGQAADSVLTINSSGSLTANLAPTPTNPASMLVNGGSSDKVVSAFKFEATDESFNVKKFTLIPLVSGSASTASNDRVGTLKVRYPKQAGGTETRTVGLSSTANLVDISDMPMYVPQNGNASLEVLVDFAPFTLLTGVEDENIAFGMDPDNSSSNNQATGASSNTDDNTWGAADINGNQHNVYRTILSAAAGSGTPTNTLRTRAASQKVFSMNLTASSTSNAFIRGSKKAADSATTGWAANGMAAPATSATAVSGSSSIILTEDGASAVNDSSSYDFGASVDLTMYNKLGFWARGSVAKAVGDIGVSVSSTADATDDATLNGLGTVDLNNSNLPQAITNASQWYYMEYSVTTSATSRFVTFNIKANVDNAATINIDDLRFYRDSINVDISGDLNATIATSNGSLFSLKDSGGTTRMYGAFQGASNGASTAAGTVLLIAGNGADVATVTTYSDVEVTSSALALDLETSTSNLMKADTTAAESLSASVDTGNVSSAGDFVWYDNSDSAGSNNMAGITVVNPVSTTLTFANTY